MGLLGCPPASAQRLTTPVTGLVTSGLLCLQKPRVHEQQGGCMGSGHRGLCSGGSFALCARDSGTVFPERGCLVLLRTCPDRVSASLKLPRACPWTWGLQAPESRRRVRTQASHARVSPGWRAAHAASNSFLGASSETSISVMTTVLAQGEAPVSSLWPRHGPARPRHGPAMVPPGPATAPPRSHYSPARPHHCPTMTLPRPRHSPARPHHGPTRPH